MSINEKPLISIIIPNFNYGKWINAAITSVVEDFYIKKHIVVVDDGSTDGSAKKVFDLLKNPKEEKISNIPAIVGNYKNSNIKISLIVCNENRGPSAARNIGIKYAFDKSDAFSFLDADDMHVHNKLEITSGKLIYGWGNIGAVYCDYINLDVAENIKYPQYKEAFCSEKILQDCIMPSNSLVPKYVFNKIGFFDETMRVAEDWDFWIRMSKFYIGYHVPQFLSIVRTGKYNSTHTVNPSIWVENWNKIREKIKYDK